MIDINTIERFRTFGGCGPVYEVLEILDEENAKILTYNNMEVEIYSIENILNDPIKK